jgi:hypothetical protein
MMMSELIASHNAEQQSLSQVMSDKRERNEVKMF